MTYPGNGSDAVVPTFLTGCLFPGPTHPSANVFWNIRSISPRRPPAKRVFLCTDGVLARAAFFLNDWPVGTAGPWSAYRFELGAGLLTEKGNGLRAHLSDIGEYFGPTPGRRFDAGLIRPIYLERLPSAFIEDVVFRADLRDDFRHAYCTVTTTINGPSEMPLDIVLLEHDTGRPIVDLTVPERTARFEVPWPRLWSPESPNLYILRVTLRGVTPDSFHFFEETVGFRQISAAGSDFFLNGKRLLLKGVCRHEFNPLQGYSPTEAEVRRELALIRHAGFNFVRLVHSPQAGTISRIAAERGLLVSEEPGACFHDLTDVRITEPVLECLERMVRRDRNVPSVFAWLLYNECNPNNDYAIQAANLCRALDPDRLIGFADCSGQDDNIKAMADAADLSFYGINLYSFFAGDFRRKMQTFQDRPLVFTEWGGWMEQGNARIQKDICDTFVRHTRKEESLRTAGFSFWAWQDYEEYSRSEPAAIAGWTVEGLTDATGKPKEDLLALSLACFAMDHPPLPWAPQIEILSPGPERPGNWQAVPLEGIEGDQSSLEKVVEQGRQRYGERPPAFGTLVTAGLAFACRAEPLLLGNGRETLFIPVGQKVRSLAVLGQIALHGGYPSSSTWSVHHRDAEPIKVFGTPASEYEFVFDDGTTETVSLRHGREILRANNICRWWKTAPLAAGTRPVVRTTIHPSYEILRLDLYERTFPVVRTLIGIRWRLVDQESIQALYAVTVELATEQETANA